MVSGIFLKVVLKLRNAAHTLCSKGGLVDRGHLDSLSVTVTVTVTVTNQIERNRTWNPMEFSVVKMWACTAICMAMGSATGLPNEEISEGDVEHEHIMCGVNDVFFGDDTDGYDFSVQLLGHHQLHSC